MLRQIWYHIFREELEWVEMQRGRWRVIATATAFAAFVAAITRGELPRWIRVALVLGLVVFACGAGIYAFGYSTRPPTLTVAAGSADGEAVRLMSAIASRLAATNSPVRLQVVDKNNALDAIRAFSAGQADLAVARADVGDLSSAATIVVVARSVVLIVAPAGSSITEMDDLKQKTVGVVGGEVNCKVVEALTSEYGFDSAKTRFKNLALAEIPQALKSKQVDALLVVMPLSEKYLTMLRNFIPKAGKLNPTVVPIEAAGAIAAVTRYYQSYELPKGTIRGSPPIPDDDMNTLRVPFYLVANKKLSDDVAGALAKAIMSARQDLIGQEPFVAQISEPDTDKDSGDDTYIPVHPGAAAYFGGDQKSFFDKYGDQLFYGSMFLGALTPLFAAFWSFMTKDERKSGDGPLMRLHALTDEIRKSDNENDLSKAEGQIDDILKVELEKCAKGNAEPAETAALGLTTQRLDHLIAQRRLVLNGKSAPKT
jgi:TRAP transporter TAXI family solute receptor